ncbi:MAG: ABC transporter substrate-binding protein [Actinomycetota bacterium]
MTSVQYSVPRPLGRRPRRTLGAVVATVVLVVAASGCGDDSSDDSAPSAATSAPADEDVADAWTPSPTTAGAVGEPPFPVVVDHPLGSTTIEAEPARIVALTDGGELATLLALDLQPVAAGARTDPQVPWIDELLADDVELFTGPDPGGEINLETIAGFSPDLIIGQEDVITEPTLELLQEIAPTVATPRSGWRDQLRIVGAATGRVDAADALAMATEAELAAFDPELDGPAPSLAFVIGVPDIVFSFTELSAIGTVMTDAGLAPLEAPIANDFDDDEANMYSPEELEALDANVIVVLDPFGGSLETLEENPLWASLPAVQDDQIVYFDADDARATRFDSVLTVPVNLGLLQRIFAESNS